MGFFRGPGDVAVDLCRMMVPPPEKREDRNRIVAGLRRHLREIEARCGQPGRCARLESRYLEWHLAQSRRQRRRRRVPRASTGPLGPADEDPAAEKCPDRQHHRRSEEAFARTCDHAPDRLAPDDEVLDRLLLEVQPLLVLEDLLHHLPVQAPVSLRARRPYRRSLAGVQGTEMNPGAVDRRGHCAAHGVDLPREMPLADSADGGVAAHLPEGLEALRQQQRTRTAASGSEARFRPGVTAADDNDIVCPSLAHRLKSSVTDPRRTL